MGGGKEKKWKRDCQLYSFHPLRSPVTKLLRIALVYPAKIFNMYPNKTCIFYFRIFNMQNTKSRLWWVLSILFFEMSHHFYILFYPCLISVSLSVSHYILLVYFFSTVRPNPIDRKSTKTWPRRDLTRAKGGLRVFSIAALAGIRWYDGIVLRVVFLFLPVGSVASTRTKGGLFDFTRYLN